MTSSKARGVIKALVLASILGLWLGLSLFMVGCALRPKVEVRTVYVPIKAQMPAGIKAPCQIPPPPDEPAKGFDLVAWLGAVFVEFMDCDQKRAAAVILSEGEGK